MPPSEASATQAAAGALAVIKRAVRQQRRAMRAVRSAGAHAVLEVCFLTRGAQAVNVSDLHGAEPALDAILWGLARSVRLERLGLKISCVDIGPRGRALGGVCEALRLCCPGGQAVASKGGEGGAPSPATPAEPEIVVRDLGSGDAESRVARLVERMATDLSPAGSKLPRDCFAGDRTYVITGGTGALGLHAARWMRDLGASHVALLSRSGKQAEDVAHLMTELSSHDGLQLSSCRCEVHLESSVGDCFARLRETMPAVKGILHAAGVTDDHLIENLEERHFTSVFGPKVDGTLNLHAASTGLGLDFFLMYSSVTALLGSVGQANMCAANAFLDSFASHRCAQGLPGVSVQWGPWSDLGMTARSPMMESRYTALTASVCLDALSAALTPASCLLTTRSSSLGPAGPYGSGVLGIARILWPKFLARMPVVPPMLSDFAGYACSEEPPTDSQHAALGRGLLPGAPGARVRGGTSLLPGVGFGPSGRTAGGRGAGAKAKGRGRGFAHIGAAGLGRFSFPLGSGSGLLSSMPGSLPSGMPYGLADRSFRRDFARRSGSDSEEEGDRKPPTAVRSHGDAQPAPE